MHAFNAIKEDWPTCLFGFHNKKGFHFCFVSSTYFQTWKVKFVILYGKNWIDGMTIIWENGIDVLELCILCRMLFIQCVHLTHCFLLADNDNKPCTSTITTKKLHKQKPVHLPDMIWKLDLPFSHPSYFEHKQICL